MGQFLGRFKDDALSLAFGDNESPLSQENVGALVDWWNEVNCEIMDSAESGLRALGLEGLANRQRGLRAQSGCDVTVPGGGFIKDPPPLPFEGGQCPGTNYGVDFSIKLVNQPLETSFLTIYGPIEGMFLEPDPNRPGREQIVIRGRTISGEEDRRVVNNIGQFSTVESFGIDSVTAISGPDDCGNVDVGPGSYPPAGNLPEPPSVGDSIGTPRDVDTVIPINGQDVPITIEFGEPVFNGADGIRVPVNGVPIDISPDGGVTLPDAQDADVPPGESVNDKLDELLEKLEEEIGGELNSIGCDGEVTTASYLGVGLQGLNAAIQTGFALRSAGLTQLCPVDRDVSLQEVELLSTSVPFGASEVKTVDIDADVRELYIEVTGDPPGLRVFKLAGEESEARFGFWSVRYGNGNDDFSEAPTEIFTRMATMSLPTANGRDRSVRISLKSGLGYSLFIQREVS